MPLLPRLFSKPFTFSPLPAAKKTELLPKAKKTELLPKAEITASARLQQLQEKLSFRATELDKYMPSGGHLQKDNKSLSQEDRDHFFDLHKSLREPQTWKNSGINKFKKPWKKQHGPYSHFTPEGLLIVARYLEETRPALKSLREETPDYAIYKDEQEALTSYKDYLTKYEETIDKQQRYIAKSLYARIMQAFKSRDLNNHEPLSGLYQDIKLNDSNAILSEFTPLKSTLPLAQALIYCLTKGRSSLRDSLRPLMRLGPKNKLISIKQDKEWLLIPHSMEHLVPRKPAFFSSFSPGHQLRYQFFKNQQELLFKLATLNMPTSQSPSWKLESDYDWQSLLKLTLDINNALLQTDKIPIPGFFKKESTHFIEQWKTLLKERKQEINKMKLLYLEQLIQTPKPYDWVLSLNNLKLAIRQMNMEVNPCEELKKSWEVLEKNLNKQLSPPSTLSLLDNGIKQIQLGKTMSKPFFDMLLEALQSIDPEEKEHLKTFHYQYSSCLQQCFARQQEEKHLSSFTPQQQAADLLEQINMTTDNDNLYSVQEENSAWYDPLKNKRRTEMKIGETSHSFWPPRGEKEERSPQSPIPSGTHNSQSFALGSSN